MMCIKDFSLTVKAPGEALLSCQILLKQLKFLHKVIRTLFQLGFNRAHILWIPDSTTPWLSSSLSGCFLLEILPSKGLLLLSLGRVLSITSCSDSPKGYFMGNLLFNLFISLLFFGTPLEIISLLFHKVEKVTICLFSGIYIVTKPHGT